MKSAREKIEAEKRDWIAVAKDRRNDIEYSNPHETYALGYARVQADAFTWALSCLPTPKRRKKAKR